jgi:hypothetical protein
MVERAVGLIVMSKRNMFAAHERNREEKAGERNYAEGRQAGKLAYRPIEAKLNSREQQKRTTQPFITKREKKQCA